MIDSDWTFNGRLVEVIDGDTIDVEVDLGFKIQKRVRVRLVNTDTNEVYGVSKDSTEYKLGKEQSDFVKQYFSELRDKDTVTGANVDYPLTVTIQDESGKYGRWIGDIKVKGRDSSIVEELHAVFPSVKNK